MSHRRGRLLALLGTVVVLLLAALPASAQSTLRITNLEQTQGALDIAISSAGGSIDPDSVTVTLNGEEVPSSAQSLNETTLARTAILTIDASLSMEGEPIENAKAAAKAFTAGVPADVAVGLATFNTTAQVVVPPTTDRAAVDGAIDAITLEQNTALYDAVLVAEQAAGTEGSRRILLLTDGRNDGGTTTQEQAVAAAAASTTIVDAVALGDADVPALTAITSAGRGQLFTTDDPAALVGLFDEAATAVSNELLVTAEPPAAFAGSAVTVTVTASVNGEAATASAATTLLAAPATESPSPSPSASPAATQTSAAPGFLQAAWFVPAAIGVVFVGLLGLLALALVPLGRRENDAVSKRMSVYTLNARGGATEVQRTESGRSSALATQALGAADTFVKSRGLEPRLENSLAAAALPLRPAEWVLIVAGSAVGGGLLLLLISRINPVWMLVGVALGVLIPLVVLRVRKRQRLTMFNDQLPDTLTLMAGSLSAGYSLPQAVDTVVREGQEPVAGEFNKALVEARLGVPIEETLENIAIRTDSKDFAWVVMAISIQRQVGGNLSEILRIVADTLRERAYIRRQIKTLSAEGRLSAVIIAALPPLFLLYLLFARPEYVTLLFSTTLGIAMLIVAVILQVLGVLWMRAIVNFEV
jgi:tight adherence protein B